MTSRAPSTCTNVSSSTAPATMRSARRASRPGSFSRAAMSSATICLRVRCSCFAEMRLWWTVSPVNTLRPLCATCARLTALPEVAMTRSKPAVMIWRANSSTVPRMCLTIFRSSLRSSGSLRTNRSVRRSTPSV